jgi:hypothetical protein
VIRAIDHVQLAAPPGCEEEARGFYGALLGLAEVPKPERLRARGGVWFALGDQQLHVGVEERFAPARKAHPALAVARAEDLRELAARLAGAGRPVTWDGPRIYTEDSFGNRLELLSAHARLAVRALAEDERSWAAGVLRESSALGPRFHTRHGTGFGHETPRPRPPELLDLQGILQSPGRRTSRRFHAICGRSVRDRANQHG